MVPMTDKGLEELYRIAAECANDENTDLTPEEIEALRRDKKEHSVKLKAILQEKYPVK